MHTEPAAEGRHGDILAALDGSVSRVRRSPLYHLSQLAVAIAMVILPLIYLAFIAVVCLAVFRHATLSWDTILEINNGRAILVGYFGPLFIGVVVVVFMVKPLFARAPRGPSPYVVDPEAQPLLFAYVARLSKLLGAPNPREIHLDSNVNASASFRRGLGSMMGSDLVLTIGLPLVEGMSLRQLTGVLSHELGHFSQGAGMRLSYVIGSVSRWFARVVYERDSFDETLEEASMKEGHILLMLIVWGARGCVWITRRILWLLMWTGAVLSSALLRQMEYDADRYEARVAGSAEFAAVAERLAVLGVGQQIAMDDLQQHWQERRLPDQFARLVNVNTELLDDASRERVRQSVADRKTGWFDTHPSDTDRIRSAEKENAPGIMQVDAPATTLFEGYEDVARAVSWSFYEGMLGGSLDDSNLVPTDRFLSDRNARARRFAALDRFFQGHVARREPVFLSTGRIDEAEDAGALRKTIEEERGRVVGAFPEQLSAQGILLRDRLYHGLQLLHDPDVRDRIREMEAPPDMQDVERKVAFLHDLEQHFDTVLFLRSKFEELVNDVKRVQPEQDDEKLVKRINSLLIECSSRLRSLSQLLSALPYPYEHAQADCTCSAFAIPHLPDEEDGGAIMGASEHCLKCLYDLYARVLGDLTVAAEQAEKSAGFPDLPEPVDEVSA